MFSICESDPTDPLRLCWVNALVVREFLHLLKILPFIFAENSWKQTD